MLVRVLGERSKAKRRGRRKAELEPFLPSLEVDVFKAHHRPFPEGGKITELYDP